MRRTCFLGLFFGLSWSIINAQSGGLKAEYFRGRNFEQKMAFRTDAKVDFFWDNVSPIAGLGSENYSIRWSGLILAPATGTYVFSGVVDDGIRVKVGGITIIDNWGLNDNTPVTGAIKMAKGSYYNIEVEYFNGPREGEIRLKWEVPIEGTNRRNPKTVIESKYFWQTLPPKPVAPKPKPVAPKPKPVAPAVSTPVSKDTIQKYTPQNVMFEKSTSRILAESYTELDRLAAMLTKYPTLKIRIEGHTDLIGDAAMNQKLSEERAATVADYLANKGVLRTRISSVGYGGSRPLKQDGLTSANAKNRRVEFVIY